MAIEIRQMLIKSQVVQRAADGTGAEAGAGEPVPALAAQQPGEHEWRAACRRMICELLDERRER